MICSRYYVLLNDRDCAFAFLTTLPCLSTMNSTVPGGVGGAWVGFGRDRVGLRHCQVRDSRGVQNL